MEKHFQAIVQQIENTNRADLADTPARAAEALKFLTKGYHADIASIFKESLIGCAHQQIISVKNIEFYSLCEHHLLPFFGNCTISYIPNGLILGLSKFAELVDIFAHRLQIQENLGTQIADCLEVYLKPKALAVSIDAQHLCLMMRGTQKQHATFHTEVLRGEWKYRNAHPEFP